MPSRTQQIELTPNNKQSTRMAQHAGYARVAFNFALSSFRAGREKDEWRSYIDIKREFNAVKRDKFHWCSGLSQNASKNAIHNFGDAVTRWKKGQNKFPVYKNRSGKCSYQADNGEGTVDVYRKRVNLPKIGWIRRQIWHSLREPIIAPNVALNATETLTQLSICVLSHKAPSR